MDSTFQNSLQFAHEQDQKDNLRSYRDQFHIPKDKNGKDLIYFTGNSLGLQPKSAKDYINIELEDWAKLGVEGHFEGRNPWFGYHKMFEEPVARLVGALPHEVTVMNTLTTNLHLMMVSFYRPTKERNKILVEGAAFPSDQYAVESQVRFHGFDPDKSIIEVFPREGEYVIRTEDILQKIEETYGVPVVVKNKLLLQKKVSGSIPLPDKKADQLLQDVALLFDVSIQKKGDTFYFKNKQEYQLK